MLNRLKFHKCYCCGPMDYDRESGKEWRLHISAWLRYRNIIPFDPYNKPVSDEEGLENDDAYDEIKTAKSNKDWHKVRELVKPIVSIDLRLVDHADFLIVNYDVEKRPCGTIDEIVTACNQNKPVLLYCPQGIGEIHNWMFGRIPIEFMFDNWETLQEYVRHIDEDEQIDRLGRWKFFNLSEEIENICNK